MSFLYLFGIMFFLLFVFFTSCEEDVQKQNLNFILKDAVATRSAVAIENSGFESGWDGWSDTDPSAISDVAYSGSSSAKITGDGGSFSQEVSVSSNVDYTLSCYVIGSWRIGVYVNGVKKSRSGNASDWKLEKVEFNSGSAELVTIFGQYYAGEGRFDDFALEPVTSYDKISVASVEASSDDGNIPENTLDEDFITRWSAEGDGQWIRYDLGSTKSVGELMIAFYKGDSRTADFEILAGTSISDLNSVYSGTSSGNTASLESFSFSTIDARYVQIVGYGNSYNNWNSITEVEIYGDGGGDGDAIPPGEVSDLSASVGDGQVTLSWTNPSDSDFVSTTIFVTPGTYTTTLTGTSKTITGLTNGTIYTFTIKTKDASGNESTGVSISATPVSGGGGGFPADVLGISSDTWKLNCFVGNPSENPTYYDDITDAGISLDSYEDPNYFYTDGEWVMFKCYRGLGGSENSSNPRVELRELDGSGDEIYWSNEGTNRMEWTVRVDQLSNNVDYSCGVTCVGQIHGPGSSVDDIIRVQFYGDAGQSSGNVTLKISGYIAENVLGGSVFIDNGYQLDTEYTMILEYNSDDYVTLYVDGNEVFSEKMDTDQDDNYFKVGNYVQSSQGATYDGSYCLVAIKNLTVTHN